MPTADDAYAELVTRAKDVALVQSCSAVLGWDQQTYMPKAGAALRGDQLALLAAIGHEKATDPRIGELLAVVETSPLVADPESVPAANARELRHAYDRATKIPKRLVEELARVTTLAQQAWVSARAKNNFPEFRPHLEQVLAFKREEAQAVGYKGHPYDALLDEYEPGATAEEIRQVFTDLSRDLVPLIRAAADSGKKPRAGVLDRELSVDRQRWFAESAAAAIGFDFGAGRLDTTAHPFCSAFGPGDCRLTTRYNPRFFNEAFFGVLHETGHGMYEQGLPADHFGTPVGAYCSLGIHESQSRLWENQVGRGRPFWQHFFPRLNQAFPGTFDGVTPDEFYFAINEVKPSYIRVESDEATYNLHIILRFELELDLVAGNLVPADLPGAWNERFTKLLGMTPRTDAEGCLQDIHWSFGGIGYFPTYTLGNLYAAQFMDAARRELGETALEESFRAGDFSPLKDWLRRNVHQQGRRFRAGELCRRATHSPLSPNPFTRYLREKLSAIYTVC
ncbi:carboxypeptidase M32 [Fimbriiglobus ruber]|uniref:Metal-dependent carboxypeptidase n=1 Tax=Fimbriiglobus ruber TaxID=1908690 RepID=A0A225D304_9BACT|nr:carboxypeptidase M32 [Fimbriiglobus ruber]OWK35971.1 Thermostable carboxypeptidase 1 [Fimbriiglobus ruber]